MRIALRGAMIAHKKNDAKDAHKTTSVILNFNCPVFEIFARRYG